MDEVRKCRYCCLEYPILDFTIVSVINNVVYRRWRCKNCKQKLQNIRRDKIKDWFYNYKKTLSCVKCFETDFRVLDFHHEGDKEFEIADAVVHGWSLEKIDVELKKCVVLCCKCHRILHWEERHKENDF